MASVVMSGPPPSIRRCRGAVVGEIDPKGGPVRRSRIVQAIRGDRAHTANTRRAGLDKPEPLHGLALLGELVHRRVDPRAGELVDVQDLDALPLATRASHQ